MADKIPASEDAGYNPFRNSNEDVNRTEPSLVRCNNCFWTMIASLIDAMALTICRAIISYWYTISWYRPLEPSHLYSRAILVNVLCGSRLQPRHQIRNKNGALAPDAWSKRRPRAFMRQLLVTSHEAPVTFSLPAANRGRSFPRAREGQARRAASARCRGASRRGRAGRFHRRWR